MFDDLDKNNTDNENKSVPVKAENTVPKMPEAKKDPAKEELQDIFSGSEKEEKPKAFQPKETSEPVLSETPKHDSRLHKMIIPILAIFALVAVIAGAVWAYYKFVGTINLPFLDSNKTVEVLPVELDADPELISEELVENNTIPENNLNSSEEVKREEVEVNIPETIASPLDRDKDGLTDQEEIQLGTNINNVDSDRDGLFDREEVKVYKTDPLNPDTDGDTYLDGAEVKKGFNPNGEGKLYEL